MSYEQEYIDGLKRAERRRAFTGTAENYDDDLKDCDEEIEKERINIDKRVDK